MYTDLPEAELRRCRSSQTEPDGLDVYWKDPLTQAPRTAARSG
ncbi:hypothetical protein [Streptomyces sp. NPDC046942]